MFGCLAGFGRPIVSSCQLCCVSKEVWLSLTYVLIHFQVLAYDLLQNTFFFFPADNVFFLLDLLHFPSVQAASNITTAGLVRGIRR